MDGFLQSCVVVQQELQHSKGLVVVSALGGVTNALENAIHSAVSKQDYQPIVDAIRQQHNERISALAQQFPDYSFDTCQALCQTKLQLLTQWLESIALIESVSDHAKAKILGVGESLSSLLFYEALKASTPEQNIQLIDSYDYIKTEGTKYIGSPDIEKSVRLIEALHVEDSQWLVAAGFISKNDNNDVSLLGRNGSDLSAAIYASGLQAKELQIWTDVNGVFNVDPNLIEQAEVIDHLSYKEAVELSFFGAKILHPKTIGSIASYNIPTIVKNTFNPEHPGTRITKETSHNPGTVTGITALDNMVIFNISGANFKGGYGLSGRVFSCLSRGHIPITLISQSSSEYSLAFCVDAVDAPQVKRMLEREFFFELKHQHINPIEVRENLASITVVGDGMRQAHGVASAFFGALTASNVNIVAIAQDSSERSISAVIRSPKMKTAVNKVYENFFKCPRVISVILYGVGIIGSELINQIKKQQQHLLKQRIDIRVIAIANSKKLLWQEQGLSLDNYKQLLDSSSQQPELDRLLHLCNQHCPSNPVFVDCTSDQTLAESYTLLFENGLHVVAANKKANTSHIHYYKSLRHIAHQRLRQFCYETNVGAGLPIIRQLQNLIRSGDQLIKFDGILSGSLSFIMGCMEDGLSFSQAIQEAKDKGFTEPDPRDDLSGMDIARKLLIIAREFGLEYELDDVTIEPLLTDAFSPDDSINDFLQQTSTLDDHYKTLFDQAKERGETLRYAGSIQTDGSMTVKLESVNPNHPLYKIRGGENAFSFTTERYNPVPLVIRGYGAGAEVTSAGVFGDILQTIVA